MIIHNKNIERERCLLPKHRRYGIGNGQANQPFMEERTGALNCMHDQQAVVYVDTTHADDVVRVGNVTAPLQERDWKGGKLISYGVDCRNATEYPEMTGALQADAAHNLNSNNVVRTQYIVRRLTPSECARLQGFPDGWTDIPWRGKDHAPDGPRY